MNNQVFQAQSETDIRRKLDVVLRQIAGDRLTEKQRRQIAAAVGCRRQYRFQLSQTPGLPREAKEGADGQAVIRPIFGDLRGLARGPTAVLVCGCVTGEEENIIYLYLPNQEKKEDEPRDGSRKEETGSQ